MKRFAVLMVVVAACSNGVKAEPVGSFVEPVAFESEFPEPPETVTGPLPRGVDEEIGALIGSIIVGGFENEALNAIVASGDVRAAWFLADLLRFFQGPGTGTQIQRAFEELTGYELGTTFNPAFVPAFNLLIAWDLPAWEGYDERKKDLYTVLEPRWAPFFEENVSIDWRPVTWGGVLIDDRRLGDPDPCARGCIPALDDPPTVPADEVTWLADSDVVFGLVNDGDALALPRNQMEVHEMVNLTLGGDRLGIPYCTLCGSAQAYLTESVPDGYDTAVLRTSGLLSRSNKVMFDLNTFSVFDTFTGEALSGPLGRQGVMLDQITVVTSTWGEWRGAHPDTQVIAQDGGVGREYERNPLGDRDANGPIFPVGPVDPRLPVQEKVMGIIAPDGVAVAFPVVETVEALGAGSAVAYEDLQVSLDGDGLRVSGPDGDYPAHEAFWFAWSQFHPETLVWTSEDAGG